MRQSGCWVLFGLLAISPAYADGISGTYVGKGSDSAFLVQIVETTGGKLTGRYEQTTLAGGKLIQVMAAVTGASDGQTVVVTIKPGELGSDAFTASGTLNGDLLHLSGGNLSNRIDLNLARVDEAAYRTQVTQLTEQLRRANEAHARAERLRGISELTNKMLAYSEAADAQLAKFAPIEQRYRKITELMSAALARQRSIYGDGQASVARSQIGIAINQTEIEAEQLHGSLQDAQKDIAAKLQRLALELADISTSCQLPDDAELRTACVKLQEASPKFKGSMTTIGHSFDEAEKLWLGEHQKQQEIVKASDIAAR